MKKSTKSQAKRIKAQKKIIAHKNEISLEMVGIIAKTNLKIDNFVSKELKTLGKKLRIQFKKELKGKK